MPQNIPLLPFTTWPPAINLTPIPESEHQIARHIASLLMALANYERKFALAVLLFNSSHAEIAALAQSVEAGDVSFSDLDRATDTLSGWQGIAARDGALSIYHFGKTLQAIHQNLKLCPSLSSMIDEKEIQEGSRLFSKSFPGFEAIRHMVSHAAEFSKTVESKTEHSVRGRQDLKFGRVAIEIRDEEAVTQFKDNLYGRSYCVTTNGKLHSYEISPNTTNILNDAKTKIYSTFNNLSKAKA